MIPGQFCQNRRLGPPEFSETLETAGKGVFPALPETVRPGSPTARAELKPSFWSSSGMTKTRDSVRFHSI